MPPLAKATAPRGIITFNSVGHALQAIDGNGVVLGSLAVAEDALAAGKLVRVFGENQQLHRSLSISPVLGGQRVR